MAAPTLSTAEHEPSISIVMATHNRCQRLRTALLALQREHDAGSQFELLLTVDGSSDGTGETLQDLHVSFPMRVRWQEHAGPGAGRNRALEEAAGDVVLFLDDDVLPVPGLIELHRAVHRTLENAIVTGPMLAPPGLTLEPWLEWEAATLAKQYEAMEMGYYGATPRQFYTANASVSRRLALAAGGFDPEYIRAEDVELAYRLRARGARFHFVREAAVIHQPDRTYRRWLDVAREYGRYEVRLDRAHEGGRLGFARHAWSRRRRLNRMLARWCLEHARLARLVQMLIGGVVQYRGPLRSKRVQMKLCSVAYNVAFWQGVAEESGLSGRRLINLLDRRTRPVTT